MGRSTKRVLVARLDNMGDVLLSGPAVRAVADTADVVYVCSPRSREAAELLPGVSRIIEFRAEWIEADPERVTSASVDRFVDAVRAAEAEEAVVLTSFHQSPLPLALLLRLAGVGRIAAISEDYPGSLLDVRHRVDDDLHEVSRALSLAAAAGYHLPAQDDGRLRVRVGAGSDLGGWDLPADYVAVHLGASVPARAWSPAKTTEVLAELLDAGYHVVLTGGAADAAVAADICESLGGPTRVLNTAGRTGLSGLSAVLRRASLVVSGNTGPAHLAAAVGTPVVSIFAPTVPAARWRPWMVPHVLLGRQDIACAGCRARACPVAGHPCIEDISVSEVLAAAERLAPAPFREDRREVAVP